MIVDTNIIIDLLNGRKEAFKFLDSNLRNNLLLSVISVSEVYSGIRGKKEVQLLEDLLTIFELIPVNKSIAVEAGFLRNKFRASHGIETPDALIAATANYLKVPVASLDKKHFSVLTDDLVVPY